VLGPTKLQLKASPLIAFTFSRCLKAALVLLTVSILAFALVDLAPGDYFDELRLNPAVSQEAIESLRQQYGLEEPMPVRYTRWVKTWLDGSWGFSLAHQRAAGPLIRERAANTMLLASAALVLTWSVAIPAAIWAAAGGRWRTRFLIGSASVIMSIPDLVIVLLLSVAAANSRWLPTGGMNSVGSEHFGAWDMFADAIRHLVVPVAALVLSMLPVVLLHAVHAVEEALQEPYIVVARLHGIGRMRILVRHVLPVAANPMITLAGVSTGTLLSSAAIVEAVSGWPGLGHLLLQSIQQRDMHVVLGATVLSSVLLLIATTVADMLLYLADSRIRSRT
jgi:peptide/nickel transport system permease protein